MAFDYSEIAATAVELVTDFGRVVTFRQLSSGPDNVLYPWEGTSNPRGVPAASLQLSAVFAEPDSTERLGKEIDAEDFVKAKATQIAIVATSANLHQYNEVLDTDGSSWRIVKLKKLQPGPTALVYFVGLAR